jgi:hypothetical protein
MTHKASERVSINWQMWAVIVAVLALIVAAVGVTANQHWWPFTRPQVAVAPTSEHAGERERREREQHEQEERKKSRAVFLSELNPEGDRPQTGNTEYRGRELANSIFYKNVTTEQSTASPCEGAPEAYCRATSYQLEGRNSFFTCKFAIEAHSPSNNGTHWRVSVDGRVLKEGTFQPNSAAEPLSVRLVGGETLELRVTTNEPGLSEPKVIWGDAMIR